MAEKTVKKEALTTMNWVQAKEANVNTRAAKIQQSCSTGNMSNDDNPKSPKWNYNIGANE